MAPSATPSAAIREVGHHFRLSGDLIARAEEIWAASRSRAPKPLRPKLAACACLVRAQELSPFGITCALKSIADYLKVFDLKNWAALGHYYNKVTGGENGVPSREPFMLLSQVSLHLPHTQKQAIGFTAAKLLQRCPPHTVPVEDIVAGALTLACKGHDFACGIDDIQRGFSKLGTHEEDQVCVTEGKPVKRMKFLPPCRMKRIRREARGVEAIEDKNRLLAGLKTAVFFAESLDFDVSVIDAIREDIQRLTPTTLACVTPWIDDPEAPFEHERMTKKRTLDAIADNPANRIRVVSTERLPDPLTPSEFITCQLGTKDVLSLMG
eukprot:GEMP01063025.1.p1 GENE.GEMP01063025.1~~GEMP01063025.1.p1  ORF type:complete len:324 (+),score=71.64 GEMP01063025.1:38-1009(+)